MIADQNFYDICFTFFLSYSFGYGLQPSAEVCHGQTFSYSRRWKLRLRSNTEYWYSTTKDMLLIMQWIEVHYCQGPYLSFTTSKDDFDACVILFTLDQGVVLAMKIAAGCLYNLIWAVT